MFDDVSCTSTLSTIQTMMNLSVSCGLAVRTLDRVFRYYYSRPKKQTPEEFAAWAIENLRINVPMEVLAHGDRVTVVGDGRNGQDLTDVERWFIGYAKPKDSSLRSTCVTVSI